MKYILFYLLGCYFFSPLYAILDGRVQPIYLDSSYSFSNYEWARGEVHFNQGFGVGVGVTAILGITAPVESANFSIDMGDLGGGPPSPFRSRILLEKPLYISSIYGGGEIGSVDGSEGHLACSRFGDQITFITDMHLEGAGWFDDGHFSSGPFQRRSFLLDSPTPITLRLSNGNLDISDFTNGLLPRLIGGDTAGRHKIMLENMTLSFFSQNITFTGIDIICNKGVNSFATNGSNNVTCYGSVSINDDATLQLAPEMSLTLTSSIASNDYFQMQSRAKLVLGNENTLIFNRPLRIPFPAPEANTYSRITVNGNAAINGIGIGSNNTLQLGAGLSGTYTRDAVLDIRPGAKLTLNNVNVQNNNLRF